MDERTGTKQSSSPPLSRAAAISSLVMPISFGLAVPFGIISDFSFNSMTEYLFGAAFGIAFLATLVRLACSVFFESQTRLGELVLCVILIGILTGTLTTVLPKKVGPELHSLYIVLALISSCLFMGAGAAWGWGVARSRGETRWGQRLLLLALGWLIVLVLLGGVAAILVVTAARRI